MSIWSDTSLPKLCKVAFNGSCTAAHASNVLAQIEKDRERLLRKKRELQRPWLEARAKRQKASAGHEPEPVRW